MRDDGVRCDAVFSPCGTYRYRLTRSWDESLSQFVFVMLNPSTADHKADDPTIRRCIRFALREHYGGLVVVNLFGFRATDPKKLRYQADPIGPDNTHHVCRAASEGRVVAAWGRIHKDHRQRAAIVLEYLRLAGPVWCLGVTKDRQPRHPLMLRSDAVLTLL